LSTPVIENPPGIQKRPFWRKRLLLRAGFSAAVFLLCIDPAVADELPDEVFGEGYLNTLSALQSEQYLAIANEVLDRVFSSRDARSTKVQKQLLGITPSPGTDERAAA
jgi:hypothetical protein